VILVFFVIFVIFVFLGDFVMSCEY